MLHFVLKDIDPTKANNFDLFLKEINDIVFMISVGDAPAISANNLTESEGGELFTFETKGNDYKASFKGVKTKGVVLSGAFNLWLGRKRIMEVSYSVNETLPTALRAKLDCEGESLAKAEFVKTFERDFSNEAHVHMDKTLEEIRAPKKVQTATVEEEETNDNPISFEENEALIRELNNTEEEGLKNDSAPTTEDVQPVSILEVEDEEELIKELETLSHTVLEEVKNERSIIKGLNALCHDITRGRTRDFRDQDLKQQTLENGAIVKMIDIDANGYKITFRKGVLEEMAEVSFFLEKADELVFSLYLSSAGHGKITAQGSQSKITIKKVSERFS